MQSRERHLRSPRKLPSPAVLWLVAIALTFAGFRSLLSQPVVGDDLVFLTFGGLGLVWGGPGVESLFGTWIGAFVDSNHVTPLNGFIYALQMILIAALADMGLAPSWLWGYSRIVWISLALLAVSYFLRELLSCSLWSKSGQKLPLAALYILNLGVLLALMQMHGPWGYNPVLSYSVAGWGTTALGFIYLGLVISWWGNPASRRARTVWLVPLVGVAGFLLYELFLAFVLAAGVAVALITIGRPRSLSAVSWLRAASIMILVPLLAFLITQLVRLSMPAWYAGTSMGFRDLIIPVTTKSSISAFPLANALPLQQDVGGGVVFDIQVLLSAIAILGCLVISLSIVRVARPALKPSLLAILVALAPLSVVFASANLIFAVSSKYQMELGNRIGYVYLGYVPGVVVLVSSVSLLLVSVAIRFGRLSVSIGVGALLVIAVTQLGINRAVDQEMLVQWGWTSSLVNAVNPPNVDSGRCELVQLLDTSSLPLKQKVAVMTGLDSAYSARHEGEVFCSTWKAPPNIAASLTMK